MANKMFASLAHFERFCGEKAALATPTLSEGVRVMGLRIYEEAHSLFGNKERLTELSASTIRNRARLIKDGLTAPGGTDRPLYFTGKLRSELEFMHVGLVAGVGSPDPIMQWQELGTARIPSRPLLRLSAQVTKDSNWIVLRHYAAQMVGINIEGGGMEYGVLGGNIVNQFTGTLKKNPRTYLTDHRSGNSASS